MAYVRVFDGTDDEIRVSISSAIDIDPENNPITMVAVFYQPGSSGTRQALMTAQANATTTRWTLETNNNLLYGQHKVDAGGAAPSVSVENNTWGIAAISRPGGASAIQRFHSKDLTNNGTWIHEPDSTARAGGVEPTTSGYLAFGEWQDADDFTGRMAVCAVYAANLSDAEIATMVGVQAMLDLNPVGLWVFDQNDVAINLIDLTGNGANQIAITGTSVSSETVPNFDMTRYLFPVVTAILDNFNRASLGSNWSVIGSANEQLAIDGSTRLHGGVDSYTGSYWNVANFGPDVEAFVTYIGASGLAGSNYFGLWARLQDGSDTTPDAYIAGFNSNVLTLSKKIGGSDTALGTYAWNPDNGDKFGISCVGNIISAYTDEGAGWIERIRVKDSSISAAGRIALDIYDPNVDDIYLDNFGGGTIAELEFDQIRPDADTETTGWTTTPLYSKINDSSDATVIQATAV